MKYLMLCLIISFMFSCTRQTVKPIVTDSGNCENVITVSSEKYNQSSPTTFTISKCEIKGDCLNITIIASGCSGSTWKAELVSDGRIAESNPPQTYAKVLFTNNELCLAVFSKTFTYNLKPLRVSGMNKFTLHVQGWSMALLYEY